MNDFMLRYIFGLMGPVFWAGTQVQWEVGERWRLVARYTSFEVTAI